MSVSFFGRFRRDLVATPWAVSSFDFNTSLRLILNTTVVSNASSTTETGMQASNLK